MALEAAPGSSSRRGNGWAPSGPASPWECRATQSRQARPEEAQEPSWGAATKGAKFDGAAPQSDQAQAALAARAAARRRTARRGAITRLR